MKRNLQIDVKGQERVDDFLIRCTIHIDGRSCAFWTTRANYAALMYDGVFVRDGKEEDSAGCVNTTNTFKEV